MSVVAPHLPKELFQNRPDVVGKASFWARRLEDLEAWRNALQSSLVTRVHQRV